MVESCPLNNAKVIKNPENIELKKTLIVSVILKLSTYFSDHLWCARCVSVKIWFWLSQKRKEYYEKWICVVVFEWNLNVGGCATLNSRYMKSKSM